MVRMAFVILMAASTAAQQPYSSCQLSRSWYRTRFPQGNFTIVPAGSSSSGSSSSGAQQYRLKCIDGKQADMLCTTDANVTLVPLAPDTSAWALGWRYNLSIAFAASVKASDPGSVES